MKAGTAGIRATEIVAALRAGRSPQDVAGQRHFGIRPSTEQLGLSMSHLRGIAREHGHDHELAAALWAQPVHEARILAVWIADPKRLTTGEMDSWLKDFDSWAICDVVCMHLFRRHPDAFAKVREWSTREQEFEKRAAFALLASLAVHRKKEPAQTFIDLLPLIQHAADDDRNFVKKAVNWALRQIGKRVDDSCLVAAVELAETLASSSDRTARWIGRDALREFSRR